MTSIQYSIARQGDRGFVTVLVPGVGFKPADDSHPNFAQILSACARAAAGEPVDPNEVAELFDVAATIQRKFQRLSDRVTVTDGVVEVDGDPVHGTLEQQILDFLAAGEDFAPLVNFYEKLLTNPLGDVRAGIYDWIEGQTAHGGKLTITDEGNILGYKSCRSVQTADGVVFRPSRASEGGDRVNGVEVPRRAFIEQRPGDVVEMPRSKVLHAPSQACGDGLHIGTFHYAEGFYGGDTVLLVEFSPRDVVSLPDNHSTWKLRVCRYKVIDVVTAPIDAPVWNDEADFDADPESDAPEFFEGNFEDLIF